MSNRTFLAILTLMLAGMVIWSIHFFAIYGFTALACARGFVDSKLLGAGVVPLTIGVATGVAALLTAGVFALAIRRIGPRPSERSDAALPYFMRWMTAAVAALSLVAILWEGITAAIVPPCA